MTTNKAQRQHDLDTMRKITLSRLRMQIESMCDSHAQRNVTKMHETLDCLIATAVALRDPGVNDKKRDDVMTMFADARALEEIVLALGDENILYIQGSFFIDKLVESIVWLPAVKELELDEIKGGE